MKITILTPLYWPSIGGVQVSMRLSAEYLAKQGHEVTVLTTQMAHSDEGNVRHFRRVEHFPASETHQGVTIRRFPTGGGLDSIYGVLFALAYRLRLPFWRSLYQTYRLRRFRAPEMLAEIRRIQPDVLLIGPCLDELMRMALQAKRETGCKLAIKTSLHISAGGFLPQGLRLLEQFDAVITNTVAENEFIAAKGVSIDRKSTRLNSSH